MGKTRRKVRRVVRRTKKTAKQVSRFLRTLATKGRPYIRKIDKVSDVISSWPISALVPNRHEKTVRRVVAFVRDVVPALREGADAIDALDRKVQDLDRKNKRGVHPNPYRS